MWKVGINGNELSTDDNKIGRLREDNENSLVATLELKEIEKRSFSRQHYKCCD
jgi:hypothetical protein